MLGKLVACGAGLDGCGLGLAHCVACSRILAAAHFSTHLPRASTAFGTFLSLSACIQQSPLAFSSVIYSGGGAASGMVGARVPRPACGASRDAEPCEFERCGRQRRAKVAGRLIAGGQDRGGTHNQYPTAAGGDVLTHGFTTVRTWLEDAIATLVKRGLRESAGLV